MRIFIGADHRGFQLKEELEQWMTSEGFEVVDMGNSEYDSEDDFVDFALKVAEKVVKGEGVGVLLCGSGGMALVANKVKGVRAVEACDEKRARHAKTDDNANILTIPADAVDGVRAKKILEVWLNTSFKTEEKYLRRLNKIESIERKYFK